MLGDIAIKAYQMAMANTNYNADGKAVISSDDEWVEETEWDDMFEQMKKKRKRGRMRKGEVWFVEFPLEEDASRIINRPVIVLDENVLGYYQ